MNNNRQFVLIDATLESHANFFATDPRFQLWLKAYNNVPDALTFIHQIKLPYSIDVYLAFDNIFDNGLLSEASNHSYSLIQALHDLKTIRNIVVYTTTMSTDDSEIQIRSVIGESRRLREVISVVDLHFFMCQEGIIHFRKQISNCTARKETHLTEILLRNRNDLWGYSEQLMKDQERKLEALQEEHSNKPSEDAT